MNPLFSIIVPVYNIESYIEECINSILSQSFRDFELIIVDDGSKDKSVEICDRFSKCDSRIKVIHKANGGLVSARKAGISKAVGEYIFNIDGDDYICQEMLVSIAEIIKEHKPDAIAFDFIHFSAEKHVKIRNLCPPGFYSDEKLQNIKQNMLYSKRVKGINLGDLIVSIWSKVCKREKLIEFQLSVPEKIVKGEDVAVTIPFIASIETLYVSDISGYYYRNTETSMINTFKESELENLTVLIDYLDTTLGIEYSKNINAYIAYMSRTYVGNAVKNYTDYKSFRNCMKTQIPDAFLKRMRKSVSHNDFKDRVLISIIAHKQNFLLWKLLK